MPGKLGYIHVIHDRTPDCHPFPGHGCMGDLIAEYGSLVCLACYFFYMLYESIGVLQAGTGRRPGDLCRN